MDLTIPKGEANIALNVKRSEKPFLVLIWLGAVALMIQVLPPLADGSHPETDDDGSDKFQNNSRQRCKHIGKKHEVNSHVEECKGSMSLFLSLTCWWQVMHLNHSALPARALSILRFCCRRASVQSGPSSIPEGLPNAVPSPQSFSGDVLQLLQRLQWC